MKKYRLARDIGDSKKGKELDFDNDYRDAYYINICKDLDTTGLRIPLHEINLLIEQGLIEEIDDKI
jgi:hypothetical protein